MELTALKTGVASCRTRLQEANIQEDETEADLEKATEKYLEGYRLGIIECKEAYLRCASQLLKQKQSND